MKYFIILLLLSLTGCKGKEIDNSKIIYSSGIQNSLIDTVYFKSKQYIPLETNDHSVIKKISKISTDEKNIFILDQMSNKLIIFDSKGHYLNHIYSIGSGPNEYISVMDFCLDTAQKQILLLCDIPYKIMKYDYFGNFIEEKNTKELFISITTDSKNIYTNRTNSDKYELAIMDLDLHIVDNTMPLRNFKSTVSSSGRCLTSTLNCYYTRIYDYCIYELKGKTVEAKYKIDFKDNTLPKSLIDEEDFASFFNAVVKEKYIYYISNISEGNNYMFFKTNQAIFVLNKKTDTLEGYQTIYNGDIKYGNNLYFSIDNNHNAIAISLEASDLCRSIKGNPSLKPLISEFNIKEDDNPILVFYEYK